MKIKFALLAAILGAGRLAAEPLAADTAVFVQADAKSPVLVRLKRGEEVTYVGEAPAGWRRVEISGSFTGYALGKDLSKGLNVREGSNLYVAPSKTSDVLTVVEKGDKTSLVGLAGAKYEFGQIQIDKKLQGFVAVGAMANTPAVASTDLVTSAPAPAQPSGPTALGHPVPIVGNAGDLARSFSGTLVLSRRPIFNPNPPYDYQLSDSTGRRFAYVDTKRLVSTDKLESFVGLVVTLNGTIRNTVDGKDLVVEAQSIQRN
ncbi:MAG TPA: SH3 domain-containing protein [Candidatus Didemnitutus sp.]|nr:SH3 domain-containing protein [Candidatus Didemnitutus sp.]